MFGDNIIWTIGCQRGCTECRQGRAFFLQTLERFDDQQSGRALWRIGFTNHILEVPALPGGNRAGGEEPDKVSISASREILLVFRVHKRVERHQPPESSSRGT